MDSAFFAEQVQRAMWVIALASVPIILPALVAGLATGIIQAATSVNEAALSFVVKLLVVGIALALTGSAIIGLLSDFTIETFAHIEDVVR